MKRLTQKEFEEKVFNELGNKVSIKGEYKNRRTKIETKCNICGYIWNANPDTLMNGHSCPSCSNNLKKTTEQFAKEVFELVGNEYEVIGEYKGTHEKIKLKHNTCGKTFYMVAKAFLLSGQRCPYERYKKSAEGNRQTQGKPNEKNQIIKEICEKEGYEIIKGYEKANINLILKHKECGTISKIRPYHFITTGVRCTCITESKGEKVIREWFKENNIKFKEQYRFKDCKGTEKRLPFDFAIFNNNSLFCLVEFDGIQHFTPKFGQESFEATKRNDNIKNDYCKQNNIYLIRIKYNRSLKIEIFKEKIINELKEKLININMTIPSQAIEETHRRCND